jgi:hypothetical protein
MAMPDEQGLWRRYTFVRGANGRLYMHWVMGQSTGWLDLGGSITSDPEALAFRHDVDHTQRFAVFAAHAGQLRVFTFNGYSWSLSGPTTPPGTAIKPLRPSAFSLVEDDGVRWLYSFVVGTDNNLWMYYLNGVTWQWLNLGRPTDPSFSEFNGTPQASFREDTEGRFNIYVFVPGLRAGVSHLWLAGHVQFRNPSWQWASQGNL